ncbi:MAG: hypothetical protein AMXMBFR7_43760 [Planctomycetota bacterium]
MRVYKSQLKDYGLTPKMIEDLGPPDEHGYNPYQPRGRTCEYDLDRVLRFVREREPEIRAARERRDRRKASQGMTGATG